MLRASRAPAAVLALVGAAAFVPWTARGDGPARKLAGAAGQAGDGAVLVGQAGDLYRRAGAAWQRLGGGVATPLLTVWGPGAGEVWAVGARPPAYRHDGKAWQVVPGTTGANGTARLSEPGSPQPALAIGRRLFVQGGKQLVAGPTAPGLPAAVWAVTPHELLVIVDGKLQRSAPGGGWRPVPGADEPLVALGPRVALGLEGGVYTIDARLHKVPADPALAGFRPRLVALGKRVVLVGSLEAGQAVAALEGGKVVLLGSLPGLSPGDLPVGLLAGAELLVVTRAGQVLAGDGRTWRSERLPEGVAEAAHPAEPPAPLRPSP